MLLNWKRCCRKGLVTDVSGPQRNPCPGTSGGYRTLRTGQRTAWSIFKMRLCRPKLMPSGRIRPTTTGSAPISSAVSLIPEMTLPRLLSSFFELPRRSRACAIHSCEPVSVPAALQDSPDSALPVICRNVTSAPKLITSSRTISRILKFYASSVGPCMKCIEQRTLFTVTA
jgi:hypothetical protein